jgi:hypothetical protein
MELKLNEKLLFNVLLVLNNMQVHVILSSNMKQFKFALFVNSNALVLLHITHKLTFNNMVPLFLMLLHFFNKLVLLVLSKILYVHPLILTFILNNIFILFSL